MTVCDAICSEYTVGLAEYDDMPLGRAFAHYAAILARNGQDNGPSYEAMELIDRIVEEGVL